METGLSAVPMDCSPDTLLLYGQGMRSQHRYERCPSAVFLALAVAVEG